MQVKIPHYELHLNSKGNGKGVATYYRKDLFRHDSDIKEDYMQLTKFTSQMLDIIMLYRSQSGNCNKLNDHIDLMSTGKGDVENGGRGRGDQDERVCL